jgi:hypothetical protein
LFACFGHRSKKKGRSMLNWDLICLTTAPYRDVLGARFGPWFLLLHWWLLELWLEFMCCSCIHINVHKERVTVEAEFQELFTERLDATILGSHAFFSFEVDRM